MYFLNSKLSSKILFHLCALIWTGLTDVAKPDHWQIAGACTHKYVPHKSSVKSTLYFIVYRNLKPEPEPIHCPRNCKLARGLDIYTSVCLPLTVLFVYSIDILSFSLQRLTQKNAAKMWRKGWKPWRSGKKVSDICDLSPPEVLNAGSSTRV